MSSNIFGGEGLAFEIPLGALDPADSFIAGTDVLFFGSHDFVSSPADKNPHRYYAAAALQPLTLSRSVAGGGFLANRVATAAGRCRLITGDTNALQPFYRGASTDGRSIKVMGVVEGQTLDNAVTLFDGVMDRILFSEKEVEIPVRGRERLIEAPVQSGRYEGTGGVEGGDDLKGKYKPLALGYSWDVEPVYLGLVGGLHTFQVSSDPALPINDVPSVRIDGVSVTKVGSSPSAGEYSINTSTGLLTLGGALGGTLRCHVEGYVNNGAIVSAPSDIILSVLTDFAGVSNSRIDYSSFARFRQAQAADYGIWIGTAPRSARAVISEIMAGAAGYGGFNRADKFQLFQLQNPANAVRADFDRTNSTITKVQGAAIIDPPPWYLSVGWRKNESPTTQIADGATEAERRFMALQYREAADSNDDIALKFASSKPVFVPANFRQESDALAEAARLLALYRDKGLWRVKTGSVSRSLDIGQTVTLTNEQFNLNKRLGTIVGYDLDFRRRETVLEVFA